MHVVIVAGPSGAGKSAFLHELRAGRIGPEILRHLPPGVRCWPVVNHDPPRSWQPFVTDPVEFACTAGFIIHYDITCKWWALGEDLVAHDPLWEAMGRCDGMTLVLIRPTQRRLLRQWSLDRLKMPPWKVHARGLLARSAVLLLACLRLLRVSKHPRVPGRTRYPRPVRFLKHADHALRGYRTHLTGYFNLYRSGRNIEQMLRCWDDAVLAKTAALPVTRIELTPDPATRIGKTFGWCLVSTEAPTRMRSVQAVVLSNAG